MQLKMPERSSCCPTASDPSIVLWGYTQLDTYDITRFSSPPSFNMRNMLMFATPAGFFVFFCFNYLHFNG